MYKWLFILTILPWVFSESSFATTTSSLPVANPGKIDSDPDKKPAYKDPLNICGQSCAFITAAEMMSLYSEYYRLHSLKGSFEGQSGYESGKAYRKDMADAVTRCLNNSNCSQEDKFKMVKASVTYNFGKDLRRAVMENQTNAENMKTLMAKGQKAKANGTGFEPWLHAKGTWRRIAPNIPNDIKNRERDPFRIPITEDFGLRTLDEEKAILGPEFIREYGNFINTYTNPKRRLYNISRKVDGNKDLLTDRYDDARFSEDQITHGTHVVRDAVASFTNSVRNPELKVLDIKSAEQKVWDYSPSRLHELGFIRTQRDKETGLNMIKSAEELKEEARAINREVEKKSAEVAKSGATQRGIYVDLDKFNSFLDELWPTQMGNKAVKR